jgi:hypothetical protein
MPNRRGSARVSGVGRLIEADMIQRIAEDLFTWLNLVGNTMPPRHPISQTRARGYQRAQRRRIGVREYWSNWDTLPGKLGGQTRTPLYCSTSASFRMPTLVGFPRACGGRQPCAVMQSLALGPQVAFLEAADPAANRQGVSQIQASRGYQSSMRRVLQLSTARGGHFEAPFHFRNSRGQATRYHRPSGKLWHLWRSPDIVSP